MRQLGAQRCHPWVNAVVRKILCEVKELHPENSGQLPNLGLITMNRLASILPAAQVLVHVDATSKKRAFEEAGLLFESQQGLSRALITDSLFARERLGSTGLGHGVAIPHGRIKGLKQPQAALLRLRSPIGFDAPDGEPVSLIISLLIPQNNAQQHLEILSDIAHILGDAQLREKIKTVLDASSLHTLLAG